MIDFFTAQTPNGKKVALMLEELGVEYKTHQVNLANKEQKSAEFIAMNPNGRIPVLVDHEGTGGQKVTVFESAAILYYLAEKHGKFLGENIAEKTQVMQWVMFQMSGIGPMFGNYYYGVNTMQPKNPGFIERFEKEAQRLLSVMEAQLSQHVYLAGDKYSIADICTYHWIAGFKKMAPTWFEQTPSIHRWLAKMEERPAVQKVPA